MPQILANRPHPQPLSLGRGEPDFKELIIGIMDPIDQLLQSLNPIAQPLPPAAAKAGPSQTSSSESIESLLQRLGEPQKQQVRDRLSHQIAHHPPIIPELQTYANEKAEADRIVRDRDLQELRSQANQWLQTLGPMSTEGLWFNDFATHGSDRLEMAIEYLAALQADKM